MALQISNLPLLFCRHIHGPLRARRGPRLLAASRL